jgi:eukaryotic-like serine/threonine-protein kinase
MGAVAAATHLVRRAPVALKFIDPDQMAKPGWADRFVNEAIVASKIDCEHVVRVFDVGRLPSGAPFLVMERLEGTDLERRLQAQPGGRFEVAEAVDYVLQILRALQVAHAAGVVHRDLKPANAFLVEREGEGGLVKLLDFGISRLIAADGGEEDRLTQTNVALGTPLYISPEQARDAHGATPRSDLYSVGAVLYELLSGRTPFQAETASELLFKLFTQEPPPLASVRPDLPPGLDAVVHRALAKEPAERPPCAVAFARLLAPFADARSARVLERLMRPPSAPRLPTPHPAPGGPSSEGAEIAATIQSPPRPPAERPARLTNPSMAGEAKSARSPARWALLAVVGAGGLAAGGALLARTQATASRGVSAGVTAKPEGAPPATTPAPSFLATATAAPPPDDARAALSSPPATSAAPPQTQGPADDVVPPPSARAPAPAPARGKAASDTRVNPYGFELVK